MTVNFNFSFISEEKISLSFTDRSFQYGDGLFETIIFKNNKIQFLADHVERLKKGMKALGIKSSKQISQEEFKIVIRELIKKNNIETDARIKITVWRKEGGLYTPSSNKFNILFSIKSILPYDTNQGLRVSFAESSSVQYSMASAYKTTSSLPYVLAGLEKKEKEVDDMVILNSEGYIAELISSNIFWIKENIVYTPKVTVGCVGGVARKNVIEILENDGYKVRKVFARKYDLLQAEYIFSVNVTGVYTITQIDDISFKTMNAWKVLFEKAYE